MEKQTCLSGEGLIKRFGDLCAVNDVTLSLREHEILGLIGPNGAGKSTLLSLLAGLLMPDAGTATIMRLPALGPPESVRPHLGFLSGDTLLYDRLTVRETLSYFGRLYRLSDQQLKTRIEQLIEDFHLAPFIEQRCASLSTGQLQRANFARALIHDPKVIILDEATNSLDVFSQSFIIETVRRLREEGRAILFASHQMGEVEALADRVAILMNGTIVEACSMSDLQERAAGQGLSFYLQTLMVDGQKETR